MKNNSKKLIIWDFDGVLADTESIWIKNFQQALREVCRLDFDLDTTIKYFGGMSYQETKKKLEEMGYREQDALWQRTGELDELAFDNGFELTPGLKPLLSDEHYAKCIATGDSLQRTLRKLNMLHIDEYFNEENIFTAFMVKQGKPAPDIFLLAAEKMGFEPDNCIVVEDSQAGMTAGIRAGMNVIGFIQYAHDKEQAIRNARAAGVTHIAQNMQQTAELLK